jgi:hypothetical protein
VHETQPLWFQAVFAQSDENVSQPVRSVYHGKTATGGQQPLRGSDNISQVGGQFVSRHAPQIRGAHLALG